MQHLKLQILYVKSIGGIYEIQSSKLIQSFSIIL